MGEKTGQTNRLTEEQIVVNLNIDYNFMNISFVSTYMLDSDLGKKGHIAVSYNIFRMRRNLTKVNQKYVLTFVLGKMFVVFLGLTGK